MTLKLCVLIGSCLVGAALSSTQAASPASKAQNFDLACAVVSAAETASTEPATEARDAALHIHWFYLGRLSGRDGNTYWTAIIKGKLAELKDKAKNSDVYGECLVLAAKQIEELK